MTGDAVPLLRFHEITKAFPGVRAVDRASFTIERGEVHGLVGENGAGKSTLIKILAGAVARDDGEIYLDGRPIEIGSVHDSQRLGFAFIHQELNLVPYFNAAENIYLGHAYPQNFLGKIRWRELKARAHAVLADLGVAHLPVDEPVGNLSPGQQTMISIARAFAADSALMVMDEPTAALSQEEIDHLYAAIERLRRRGVSVLYVSHRLQELFDLTDRMTVMRNGKVVSTLPTPELDRTTLIRLMTGRTLDAVFPPPSTSAKYWALPVWSGLVVRSCCGCSLARRRFVTAAPRCLLPTAKRRVSCRPLPTAPFDAASRSFPKSVGARA